MNLHSNRISPAFLAILGIIAVFTLIIIIVPGRDHQSRKNPELSAEEKVHHLQTQQNLRKIEEIVRSASLPKNRSDSRTNVIFIVIDTCRSDALGCCGGSKGATPNIDRLAEEAVVFPRVITPAPITLPSHCSIFTSLYPQTHGVRDNGSFQLDESFNTLAEILQKNGYSTGAVVGSFVLDRRFGLDQGFDYYHDTFKKPGSPRFYHGQWQGHDIDIFESAADEVTLEALRWIQEQRQNEFFLFLHYMDPHEPYTPPDRFLKAFPENPYYGEVAFVDECVSHIIRYLEKSGLSDNTLIVITADHGESLGEHDYTGHAYVLYDQVLLTPLIVKDPSGNLSPGYYPFQINSIDIMPSLLDLLSIPIPPDIQGKSFLPLPSGETKKSHKSSYSETLMPSLRQGKAEIYSLRNRTWKLIKYIFPKGGEKSFLYDLATDRKELTDIAARRPDIAKDMSKRLINFRELESYPRFRHMIPEDRETVDKLKALGYIGN